MGNPATVLAVAGFFMCWGAMVGRTAHPMGASEREEGHPAGVPFHLDIQASENSG